MTLEILVAFANEKDPVCVRFVPMEALARAEGRTLWH